MINIAIIIIIIILYGDGEMQIRIQTTRRYKTAQDYRFINYSILTSAI